MKITINNKTSLYNIVIWIVLIFAISTTIAYSFNGAKLFSSFLNYLKFTSFGWGLGFSFWIGHSIIGYYTEKKLDWTKNLKRSNVITLSLYIIYGIIVAFTVSYMFGYYVLENRGEVLHIDAILKAFFLIIMDLIFIAIYYSTYLTKFWKKAIESNEELKRENLLAKFETLKNQVNPHFLFNSLNTLSGVVEQKPELATGFIKKLSDIYRYVLEQSDKELVLLNDEMKFVEDYIFLSRMRFGDALNFKADIPKNNIQLVPLGLQMLVENAIKHNIITDDMPLNIEIAINEQHLVVKNNIQKKKTIIADKEPMGLDNLKNRYKYLSNLKLEVIETNEEFIVKLPYIKA